MLYAAMQPTPSPGCTIEYMYRKSLNNLSVFGLLSDFLFVLMYSLKESLTRSDIAPR